MVPSQARTYREHGWRIRELAKETRVWSIKTQLECLANEYELLAQIAEKFAKRNTGPS
jgi:hypothetical protein